MGKLRFLVPSGITLISLWFAWQAMVASSVVVACWNILKCVVFDKLDGTAARTLNASSAFGVKMDSIHDAFAFGVVPGVIVFQAAGQFSEPMLVRYTQACGVLYILGTFYRLYKFDKLATSGMAKDYFIGIPSTLAAAVFASFGVAFSEHLAEMGTLNLLLPSLALLLAILMNGRFASLKMGKPDKKGRLYSQVAFFIGVSALIFLETLPEVLFLISLMTVAVSIRVGGIKRQESHARTA